MNSYDKFLNFYKFSFICKSIRFLYPIKIADQYRSKSIYKNFISLKILIKICYSLQNLIFNALQNLFFYDKKNIKQSDILIISHFLKKKQINTKGDFYFGNLTEFFKKKKFKYSKLLINHTNFNSNYLNKNSMIQNTYILERYCDLFTEFKIFYLQIKELLKISFFYKNITSNKSFFLSVVYSLFESETKFAIRMHFLLKKHLKRINPKLVIFTHEGFPWERLCIKAVKEFNNDIFCIGYQSTILLSKNSLINKKLNGDFNPDMIWVSGESSEKILKKSKKLNKIQVLNVGFLSKKKFKKEKGLKVKQCLILPVGIYSECEMLLNFSLQCAKINKELKFIWRLHPVINKKKISKNMQIDFDKLPNNIKFSNHSLTNDAKKCSHVLYRSSAAVLDAIKYGCYPLNYKDKKETDFDILKNFKEKKYVKKFKVLSKIMDQKNTVNNLKKLAFKYYKNIYGDLNLNKIYLMINKKI